MDLTNISCFRLFFPVNAFLVPGILSKKQILDVYIGQIVIPRYGDNKNPLEVYPLTKQHLMIERHKWVEVPFVSQHHDQLFEALPLAQ